MVGRALKAKTCPRWGHPWGLNTFITKIIIISQNMGVTYAQLVKVSVIQADVQRFEPRLGHNWLSCGVFQALWAPSGTNLKARLAISLSG